MRDRTLEELVINALGGQEMLAKIADLPPLPKHTPDHLRALARYLLKLQAADEP